jgi:hypothetical protein
MMEAAIHQARQRPEFAALFEAPASRLAAE